MIFETQKTSHQLVAKNTFEVVFTRPEGFVFTVGQYTQVALGELLYPDPKGRSRQFSIATSPLNLTEISVVFRDTSSGFKRTLIELPIGSLINLEQGAGSFGLPIVPTKPLVFVAGGVGISPFLSYFRTIAETTLPQSITLLYGNQHPESAAFRNELSLFAKKHQQFKFEEIYKQPTPQLFTKYASKFRDATWFVVGPPGMVATTVYGLEAAGIHPNSIIKESFDGY
jgi:ferredoxin-NADP reductase